MSLLVAGSVVLAGIQSGSLHGAVPEVAFGSPASTLKCAAILPAPDNGTLMQFAIPGYQGAPRLQVLSAPDRIVLDLPGVDRGPALTRKEIGRLTSPLIIRWRAAQFSSHPDVTRVVLEVVPGTKAEVNRDAEGVTILLHPGRGNVQASLAPGSGSSRGRPTATEAVPASAAPARPLCRPWRPCRPRFR